MIPASHMGSGTCFAFPDVCKTPSPGGPVPIPYPNIGQNAQIKSGSAARNVNITKKKAAIVTSEVAMTSGDEAGSAGGGVVSSKNKGPAKFLVGYPKVNITKKNPAMLGSMTQQNDTNIVGAQIAPSQTKVLYAPVPVMPAAGAEIDGDSEIPQAALATKETREDERKSLFVHAFKGSKTTHLQLKRHMDQEPSGAAEAAEHYKPHDFLLAAGHVGVSFEGESTILGFTPDTRETFAQIDTPGQRGWQLFYKIIGDEKRPFEGNVHDDTEVFAKAKADGSLQVVEIEYRLPKERWEQIRAVYSSHKSFPKSGCYAFPDKNGIFPAIPEELSKRGASQMNNCAVWPPKVADAPTPCLSPLLSLYMQSAVPESRRSPIDL